MLVLMKIKESGAVKFKILMVLFFQCNSLTHVVVDTNPYFILCYSACISFLLKQSKFSSIGVLGALYSALSLFHHFVFTTTYVENDFYYVVLKSLC